jgi:hypothetical protein
MAPMLDAARKVEAELKRNEEKSKLPAVSSLSAMNSFAPDTEREKRIEELTRELNKLKVGASNKTAVKCYGCGRLGHIRRECRSSGQSRGSWQQQRGRGNFRGFRGGSNFRGYSNNRGGFRSAPRGNYNGSRGYSNNSNYYNRSGQQNQGRQYYVLDSDQTDQREQEGQFVEAQENYY